MVSLHRAGLLTLKSAAGCSAADLCFMGGEAVARSAARGSAAAARQSAIDRETDAVDVGGAVGGEENSGVSDVLRGPHAAGRAHLMPGRECGSISAELLGDHGRLDEAGQNGVGPDAVAGVGE